jgi:hypothetical protein
LLRVIQAREGSGGASAASATSDSRLAKIATDNLTVATPGQTSGP